MIQISSAAEYMHRAAEGKERRIRAIFSSLGYGGRTRESPLVFSLPQPQARLLLAAAVAALVK